MVREYVGQGPIAELAHQMDINDRLERDEKRNDFGAVRGRDAELDGKLDSCIELSEAVASGLLIVAGYHQHKRGNWRKRNERCQE